MKGVPFALNTIVSFIEDNAIIFYSFDKAQKLCEMLNQETKILHRFGFNKFEINGIKKRKPKSCVEGFRTYPANKEQ